MTLPDLLRLRRPGFHHKRTRATMLDFLKKKLVSVWKISDEAARSMASETMAAETEELVHIFAILTMGSFVGLPSPPMNISLDLMPYMERELMLLIEKVNVASEPISELFSTFDID